jgi:CBS-domain-containing membrane protein
MIKLEPISPRGELAPPQTGTWQVKLEDTARTVMTDFNEHNIVTVRAEQQIDEALEHMRHTGVRAAFVLDAARSRVLGLVTAYDIMGEKPMRFTLEMGTAREQVVVGDIMEAAADWKVLQLADIDRANVAAVLDVFKRSRRTHLPVMEPAEGGGWRVRGVLSSAKVLRLTAASRGA